MGIKDLLHIKSPTVWVQGDSVVRLLSDGSNQTFTPAVPEDLELVKKLVKSLEKAQAGYGEIPELEQEEIEEQLLPLLKH